MSKPDPHSAVAISGSGVAANCSSLLLGRAGVPFSRTLTARPRVPVIMVGAPTQALIADIWNQPALFAGAHRIQQRVVAWGADPDAKRLPHSAVVVSEEQLNARLEPPSLAADNGLGDITWTIHASRPLPEGAGELHFGTRRAQAVPVRLRHAGGDACYIESLDAGWLFLLPNSPTGGWLVAVGGSVESLLGTSRLIAPQVDRPAASAAGDFACDPRIAEPLCGPGWLACGTAAMGFDPICGDGTGNAVREAILACAVIRAARSGTDPEALRQHYRLRLVAGLERHLEQCRQFYASGPQTDWWRAELEQTRIGLDWCRKARQQAPQGFRFQLRDYDLVPVS